MKITRSEAHMIVRIAEDEYGDSPEDSRWTNVICENHSDNAVVGSLSRKGLLDCFNFGPKKEWTLRLTSEGCMEYRKLKPESDYTIQKNRDEHYERTVLGR